MAGGKTLSLFIWLVQHEVSLGRSVTSQALPSCSFPLLCCEGKVRSHPWPAVVDVGRAAGQVTLQSSQAQCLPCQSSLAALYFCGSGSIPGMLLTRGSGTLGLLHALEFSWAGQTSRGKEHLLLLQCDHCQGFHPSSKAVLSQRPGNLCFFSGGEGKGVNLQDDFVF